MGIYQRELTGLNDKKFTRDLYIALVRYHEELKVQNFDDVIRLDIKSIGNIDSSIRDRNLGLWLIDEDGYIGEEKERFKGSNIKNFNVIINSKLRVNLFKLEYTDVSVDYVYSDDNSAKNSNRTKINRLQLGISNAYNGLNGLLKSMLNSPYGIKTISTRHTNSEWKGVTGGYMKVYDTNGNSKLLETLRGLSKVEMKRVVMRGIENIPEDSVEANILKEKVYYVDRGLSIEGLKGDKRLNKKIDEVKRRDKQRLDAEMIRRLEEIERVYGKIEEGTMIGYKLPNFSTYESEKTLSLTLYNKSGLTELASGGLFGGLSQSLVQDYINVYGNEEVDVKELIEKEKSSLISSKGRKLTVEINQSKKGLKI